jgi:glycosyltransferase involved in cell wall biosynthesis
MKRLTIIASHPIQHFSPWFRALASEPGLELCVLYGSKHGVKKSLDAEFGKEFSWDIPLLNGYRYEFLHNRSLRPGVSNFLGIWIPDLFNRLTGFQADVLMILGWQLFYYWHAAFCAKKMGIPYVVRGESNLLKRGNSVRWKLKRLSIGRLCRMAACCLAIGSRNAALYKAYGVDGSKIKQAPYFVDNDRFGDLAAHLKPKCSEFRKKFGLPEKSIVFLFVGKLIPKKHPDILMQAFLSLPVEKQKQASILIVGDGVMRESLEQMTQRNSNISFAGFLNQSRIPEAYAASDVLVLPSDAGETWGLVVNEAMASGLPVIVSDHVGCAPDLVHDGKTGFIVPLGDVRSITNKMHQLIEEQDVVINMGEAAKARVQEFSIHRAVREVIAMLESLSYESKNYHKTTTFF